MPTELVYIGYHTKTSNERDCISSTCYKVLYIIGFRGCFLSGMHNFLCAGFLVHKKTSVFARTDELKK